MRLTIPMRAAMAAVCALLCGCGDGSSVSGGNLEGVWDVRSLRVNNGAAQNCPAAVAGANGGSLACGGDDRIEFERDNNVTVISEGARIVGLYALQGTTLTLRRIGFVQPIGVYTLARNGNTLTLTVMQEGSFMPPAQTTVARILEKR